MRTDQMQAAEGVLKGILGDELLAVYLHGSAVLGGLRPQSDIDLLAIVDRAITDERRRDLLAALLTLSGHHPATPGRPRCIELIVFRQSELLEARFPAHAEFTYGEWLRDGFEAGELPVPGCDPEYTLLLAQARQQAVPLLGPSILEFLPEIPLDLVRQAMRDVLPALLDGLRGDERNVLLTLARMWRTSVTGEFVTKDAAAAWAIPQIPSREAATLEYAKQAYSGDIVDTWGNRFDDAEQLAEHFRVSITKWL